VPASASFEARIVQIGSGGADTEINTALEAEGILNGTVDLGDYDIILDTSAIRTVIDLGSGGAFGNDLTYPDGAPGDPMGGPYLKDQFTVSAMAEILFPAGTWSIAFGSDDGGLLRLPGITFTSEFGTNGDAGLDDTLLHDSTRPFQWTTGVFTVGSDTTLTLDALFFEYVGSDGFEIAVAQGNVPLFNTTDYQLLQDGVFGLSVIPIPEPSTAGMLALGLVGLAWVGRRRAR